MHNYKEQLTKILEKRQDNSHLEDSEIFPGTFRMTKTRAKVPKPDSSLLAKAKASWSDSRKKAWLLWLSFLGNVCRIRLCDTSAVAVRVIFVFLFVR
jgi:hypothetical protein